MSSPERHESDVNTSEFVFRRHLVKGHALVRSKELELSRSVVDEAAGGAVRSRDVQCRRVSLSRISFLKQLRLMRINLLG